jgi:hypothetical protein
MSEVPLYTWFVRSFFEKSHSMSASDPEPGAVGVEAWAGCAGRAADVCCRLPLSVSGFSERT